MKIDPAISAPVLDILLITAIRDELKGILKMLPKPSGMNPRSVFVTGTLYGSTVGVLVSGVGGCNAAKNLSPVVSNHRIRNAVVLGWSGALSEDFRLADLVLVTDVFSSQQTKDGGVLTSGVVSGWCAGALRASGMPFRLGTLVTVDKVITRRADRDALRAGTGADMVDMETRYFLEILGQANVPAAVIRCISDSADERIGIDFESLPEKQPARSLYLLKHPQVAVRFGMLLQNLRFAAGILHRAAEIIVRRIPPADQALR